MAGPDRGLPVPWPTRAGVVVGPILGLIAVGMTESIGADIFALFGMDPLWGR
ncbi:MAG: hypothetical protein LJE91_10540 [Gammaproteobacteria bacterium]|nr:hypothetical protein [Gammaproteobacteria bacterium]